MQYTISTISALVAALSLVSAAPMPSTSSSSSSSSSSSVTIVLQLEGFDAASTLNAKLDATTVNSRAAKSAALQQAGPWCAGFSDSKATKPVQALNGDGIFDSANEAVYSEDEAVTVGSFWCAQTRKEVENFVAKATGGSGSSNDNNNQNKQTENNNQQADNTNNNNQQTDADNNNAATSTVRVQIELEAGTTFVQAELPANGGQLAASTVRNLGTAISIDVVGEGSCKFFDANGVVVRFGAEKVAVASFECEA